MASYGTPDAQIAGDASQIQTVEQRHTAINVQLFAMGEEALTIAREARPKNTNKTYDPKQKEWRVSSRRR
jgi:hypothetical protein